jgi:Recombination endonuclease VII
MFSSNEWRRRKYATDPEYRRRRLAYNRAYERARRSDPAYREKLRAYKRAYQAAHRDYIREWQRRHFSKPAVRARYRAHRYGLSAKDLQAMLGRQGGVCAICKQKPRGTLCIDHCHATNKVRGLLCDRCNIGLGCFRDSASRLQAAIEYIVAHIGHEDRNRPQRPPKGGNSGKAESRRGRPGCRAKDAGARRQVSTRTGRRPRPGAGRGKT